MTKTWECGRDMRSGAHVPLEGQKNDCGPKQPQPNQVPSLCPPSSETTATQSHMPESVPPFLSSANGTLATPRDAPVTEQLFANMGSGDQQTAMLLLNGAREQPPRLCTAFLKYVPGAVRDRAPAHDRTDKQ